MIQHLKKNNNIIKNKIISFVYDEFNKRDIYLGDIIISFEFVFKRSIHKIFLNEFNKVWIHGFLHLLGHDHIKNKDYKKMQYLENKILKLT